MSQAHATRSAYAGRDVLNAPALKAAILQRSQQRGDAPEVQAWLGNHFYRHLVGNFLVAPPAVQSVEDAGHARRLLGNSAPPEWVMARLRQHKDDIALWWVDPASPPVLALEAKLLEFLTSRRGTALEGKLMRVNCPQALALWATEHAAFEAQAAMGLRQHHPGAVQTVWQGTLGQFVEFQRASADLRAEMAFESQCMQHCLGQFADRRQLTGGYGEQYATACEHGQQRLFSFRSAHQQPHITISAEPGPDGRLTIAQIKGKQNRPPIARYHADVLGFLNTLPTTEVTPPDAAAIGLLRLPRGWCAVADITDETEQLHAVHRFPAVAAQLPSLSLLAQWTVAARHPEVLVGQPTAPQVAYALKGAA